MQMFPPIKQTLYNYDTNALANSFKPSVINHNLFSKFIHYEIILIISFR